MSAHEIVGRDICRLHDFYKSKGVRIAMWAESAQTFVSYKGSRVGADDYKRIDGFGIFYQLPATYKSIDMLPNDILMLDWYHSQGYQTEACFDERGFEVIYGNFQGSQFGEFDIRSKRACVKGAEVSTWCPTTEDILASDGILFQFMFSSQILWDANYNTTPIINDGTAVFAYEWKNPRPDKKIIKIRPYTFRKDYTSLGGSADRSQAVVLFGIFIPE